MVLVDTSVWIRFLAGVEPFASKLDGLLADNEVLGHGFVYGELLIGDRGNRAKFLAGYKVIHQADLIANAEVIEFVRHRKINGLGIGWVDAHLLASAVIARGKLWTADRALASVADSIGVQYHF